MKLGSEAHSFFPPITLGDNCPKLSFKFEKKNSKEDYPDRKGSHVRGTEQI